MNFKQFMMTIKENTELRMGEEYNVRINEVIKNNGVVLHGMTIMNEKSNISPTIYLEQFYQQYQSGEKNVNQLMDELICIYEKNEVTSNFDIEQFMRFDNVKGRIIYKLINTEKNRKLLEDVPSIEILDLSVIFQCLMQQDEMGNGTITIHNAHMQLWDVTTEELMQLAQENTPKLLQYELKNISSVMCELMKEDELSEEIVQEFNNSIPMYVLSNRKHINGASALLYSNILEDFAEAIDDSFYILPSSVHEVIFIPAESSGSPEDLKEMVREVNATQVEDEEVLSDSVYHFDNNTNELTLV